MNFFGKKKNNPLAGLLQPSLMEMLGPGGDEPPPPSNSPSAAMNRLVENDPNYPWKDNTLNPPKPPSYAELGVKGPPPDNRDALRSIQGGMLDLYKAKMPLFSAERFELGGGAGANGPKLEELKQGDPVDFFRTYAPQIMKQSYMQGIPSLDEKYAEAQKLMQALNSNPLTAAQQQAEGKINALPDAYTPEEKMSLLGTDKKAPVGQKQDLDSIFQTSDEKEKNLDLGMGGGLVKGALHATSDILKKYGDMAQTLTGAKAALKHEFEDTPELDAIIAKTESELAKTRAERKQMGTGDFLVMALLNLGGMNPRQSADLVLGLGQQERREGVLDERLAGLEGSRAGAKMHGRQSMRAMQQQEKYQALRQAMQQQEAGRKQHNEDRDFGFKSNKLGFDKLMQELGQVRQQMQFETDPQKRKALQSVIDRLDPYGKQQPPPPPKDQRQSRLFGDSLMGGGGFA